jgi:hypothetical protein
MSQKPIKPSDPMTVEEINRMTVKARALPPSGDQTNVLIADGEDPWVTSHQGVYYYCTVDRAKKKIQVSKFERLTEVATAQLVEVYPANLTDIPDYIEIWSATGTSTLPYITEIMGRNVCTLLKVCLTIRKANMFSKEK